MLPRLSGFSLVFLASALLAGCGQTASEPDGAEGDDAGSGGTSGGTGGTTDASGGYGGGFGAIGGVLTFPKPPWDCDPEVDSGCWGTPTVRDELQGTLVPDAVLPTFTEGACGSGSELELVAAGLRNHDRFGLAAMPTTNAPDAVYFVHSLVEGVVSVGRIAKSDCAYDAAFKESSDLAAVGVTTSHILWRPALGSIAPHFQWDALSGSSSAALAFAGGHPVGANETEVFLHEVTGSGAVLSRFDGKERTNVASIDAEEFRIFGKSALATTSGGLARAARGTWVDLETGDQIFLGIRDILEHHALAFWESAVIYENFLYYCDEGVVRVDRSNDHVRIVDAPCEKLVHADESGLYFTTPNGLARAALDGSSPELVAPGGELFDDTHIYFFEDADLWRIARPDAP
jgi:hypothetical protein